jgi:type II secretory pathway pseudopilin PulG
MAALLVAMSIMAVMMTVAMPVWKQSAQREKEEELIFRGKQYVHAIALFQRKFAGAYPPNVNVLVDQKFLRKKYKDPITDDDFVPIPFGQQIIPGAQNPQAAGRSGQSSTGASGPGRANTAPGLPSQAGRGGSTFGASQPAGGGLGIQGVTSKSKDESIRIYNGRTHYNEWAFVYTPPPQQGRGANAPGQVPGQGGPGQQPGPFGVGPGGQRGRGDGRGFPGRGFPNDGSGFPGRGGDGRGPGGPGRGFGPGQPFPGQPFPGQPGQPGRGRGPN